MMLQGVYFNLQKNLFELGGNWWGGSTIYRANQGNSTRQDKRLKFKKRLLATCVQNLGMNITMCSHMKDL